MKNFSLHSPGIEQLDFQHVVAPPFASVPKRVDQHFVDPRDQRVLGQFPFGSGTQPGFGFVDQRADPGSLFLRLWAWHRG